MEIMFPLITTVSSTIKLEGNKKMSQYSQVFMSLISHYIVPVFRLTHSCLVGGLTVLAGGEVHGVRPGDGQVGQVHSALVRAPVQRPRQLPILLAAPPNIGEE